MKRQKPLGGKLVNRILEGEKKEKAIEASGELTRIHVRQDSAVTLEMIATGVLSPLDGFQGYEDYHSVLKEKRLADGTPWTLPQLFAPNGGDREDIIKGVKEGDDVALVDDDGKPVAILHVEEKFSF